MIPAWNPDYDAQAGRAVPFLIPTFIGSYGKGETDIIYPFENPNDTILPITEGEFSGNLVSGAAANGEYGFRVELIRVGIYGVVLIDAFTVTPGILLNQDTCVLDESTIEDCPPSSDMISESCPDANMVNESTNPVTMMEEACPF